MSHEHVSEIQSKAETAVPSRLIAPSWRKAGAVIVAVSTTLVGVGALGNAQAERNSRLEYIERYITPIDEVLGCLADSPFDTTLTEGAASTTFEVISQESGPDAWKLQIIPQHEGSYDPASLEFTVPQSYLLGFGEMQPTTQTAQDVEKLGC